MPRTAITPQRSAVAGLSLVTEPANVLGNTLPLNDRLALVVKNGSASSINVTIPSTTTVDGLVLPNRVIAVPAGTDRYIRPSSVSAQAGGVVNVDYSAVTTVTVAVLEV